MKVYIIMVKGRPKPKLALFREYEEEVDQLKLQEAGLVEENFGRKEIYGSLEDVSRLVFVSDSEF